MLQICGKTSCLRQNDNDGQTVFALALSVCESLPLVVKFSGGGTAVFVFRGKKPNNCGKNREITKI